MSEASEDARARLRFHVELQEGFWFALVVGPDEEARAVLRDDAAELAPVADFEAVEGEEVAVASTLAEPRTALAWVRVDDRRTARALLAAMNERREAYRNHAGAGVVVEGPSWLKADLRNAAPDLFSIRACILEPTPEEDLPLTRDETEERAAPAFAPLVHRLLPPADEVRTTIERELHRAASLRDRAEPTAVRARIASLRRAAQALLDQGWVGEAHGIVTELLGQLDRAPGELWVLPERATAWELLGRCARELGDLDETREAFDVALSAIRELRGDRRLDGSTAGLQEDEARLWWLLGEVAWSSGELGRAQDCLGHALALREELLEFKSPGADDLGPLREGIARTWSLLADVAAAAGRPQDAADAWVAALEIRSDLVELDPHDRAAIHALSISLGRVARVAWSEGDWLGALDLRRRAWELMQDLAEAEPDNATWLVEASTARTRLAQILLELGRLRSARFHMDAIHAVRLALLRRDPDNVDWSYRYAATCSGMAELALAEGAYEDAAIWAHRAVSRLDALRDEDPDRITWTLAAIAAREWRGEAYVGLGQLVAAAADFAAAGEAMGQLVAEDPRPKWVARRSRLWTREGDAWFALGRGDRAARAWLEALAEIDEPGLAQLGAVVGLAQLGRRPAAEALALIERLDAEGALVEEEAAIWRAALAV